MFKKILLILIAIFLLSCGKDYNYGDFPRDKSHYDPIINDRNVEVSKTNLTSNKNPILENDIYLENRSFGIQVALYKNNKFSYTLSDLGVSGNGYGNWSFRDGIFIIDTNGKRKWFDMVLHIFSADPEGKTYKVRFRDRFGWQVLKLNVLKKAKTD